jgi:hypothetical protein
MAHTIIRRNAFRHKSDVPRISPSRPANVRIESSEESGAAERLIPITQDPSAMLRRKSRRAVANSKPRR